MILNTILRLNLIFFKRYIFQPNYSMHEQFMHDFIQKLYYRYLMI